MMMEIIDDPRIEKVMVRARMVVFIAAALNALADAVADSFLNR
jgi:hypothetical protein